MLVAEPMPPVGCPKTAKKKPGEKPNEEVAAFHGAPPLLDETLNRKFDNVPRPETVQLPAPSASRFVKFEGHAGGRAKAGIQIAPRHTNNILRIKIAP